MSFRKELKSLIFTSKIGKLKNWIKLNNGHLLYPERKINSLYLDNKSYDMYFNSIEGSVPRKKLRLRNYNDKINFRFDNSNFEVKISSYEGRFKKSENFSNYNCSKIMIRDRVYGVCYPVINVFYKRIYYYIDGIRLTIDTDINYRLMNFNKKSLFLIKDPSITIELKYNDSSKDDVINSYPFSYFRFSKYTRGVDLLNKKYNFIKS